MKIIQGCIFNFIFGCFLACSPQKVAAPQISELKNELMANYDIAFGSQNTEKCLTLRNNLYQYEAVTPQKYLKCSDILSESGYIVYRLKEIPRSNRDEPGTLIYDLNYNLTAFSYSWAVDKNLNNINFMFLNEM